MTPTCRVDGHRDETFSVMRLLRLLTEDVRVTLVIMASSEDGQAGFYYQSHRAKFLPQVKRQCLNSPKQHMAPFEKDIT